MRALVIAMLVAGCYNPPREAACTLTCTAATGCPAGLECNGATCTLPGGSCGDAGDAGVGPDTPPDGPAAVCYGNSDGTGLIKICFAVKPQDTLMFPVTTTEIDTTAGMGCTLHSDGNVDVCVVSAGRLVVPTNAIVRALGERPLVLAAEVIDIAGTLDVAANPDDRAPAGSAPDVCGAPPVVGLAGTGGAGGSFVGTGGTGGAPGGATANAPNPPQMPELLRGGCDGQSATQGGAGGQGGGAVYLAANQITITGLINASGGGADGSVSNGGGGGGSGGLIGLDAIASELAVIGGRLVANGGGGGCGRAAGNGSFPDPTSPGTAALGGCSGTGGEGGSGSAGATLGGTNGNDGVVGNGGGGGGGGAGAIRTFANALVTSNDYSPPPQP